MREIEVPEIVWYFVEALPSGFKVCSALECCSFVRVSEKTVLNIDRHTCLLPYLEEPYR